MCGGMARQRQSCVGIGVLMQEELRNTEVEQDDFAVRIVLLQRREMLRGSCIVGCVVGVEGGEQLVDGRLRAVTRRA